MNRRSFLQLVIGSAIAVGFAPPESIEKLVEVPVALPVPPTPTISKAPRKLIDWYSVSADYVPGSGDAHPIGMTLSRPSGSPIMEYAFNSCATFRYLAAPNRGIIVPEGEFIALKCTGPGVISSLMYDDGTMELYEGSRLTDIISLERVA